MDNFEKPALEDIRTAAARIGPYIHHTPVMTSACLNKLTGADIYFKCENFQKVGAFKFRGATNALFSISDQELANGVATHSSGNHAQALALAAQYRGTKSYIVMPEISPRVKIEAVKGYGGKIIFCRPTLQAREETLKKVIKETGAVFIHPYNDFRIIAGQATAAMELMEEIGFPDIIMTPVGGGGLMSGTSLTVSYQSPDTIIYGAEPEGADDAKRSLKAGRIVPSINPDTIADGLLSSLGSMTFPIIRKYVTDILTVSEDNIFESMRLFFERMKIVVEPSGAVPLGAILQHREKFVGKKVGVIVSGGNVDPKTLSLLRNNKLNL